MTKKTKTPAAFAALANADQQARKEGAGYGTDSKAEESKSEDGDKPKPGRKPVPRHRTSFAFPVEDWQLIERLAEHYGGRISNTDTIVRAVREVAKREGLLD